MLKIKKKVFIILSPVLVLLLTGCAGSPANTFNPPSPQTTTTPTPTSTPLLSTIPPVSIQVERVFPGLSFREMTNLVQTMPAG
jgi:PBP1b-binding outer membrane lipoprotein LpoB